jgi:cytidyltransferase-like protein
MAARVIVSAPLDDLRSPLLRFLQEAARLGPLYTLPWPDEAIREFEGREPKFPLAERIYFLQSLRYTTGVEVSDPFSGPHALPASQLFPDTLWVVDQPGDHTQKRAFCLQNGLGYRLIPDQALGGFPMEALPLPERGARKQVIITGSFDWLHTGHVRFFEEVSAYGNLTAVVGHDANIELLKGPGHPLFKQEERLYMVQAIRYVSQAMLSSGHGWLDAEPELERLKPDIYAVNEEGDKPEKRAYCQSHGIEYLVLKREPKAGLTRRSSTDLRGF